MKPLRALIACALAVSLVAACTSSRQAAAEQQARESAPSVQYANDRRGSPNESVHRVTIDLADPRIHVSVAGGGADPDGDGPWTTTLLPVREIANREGFDIAVNGDFFETRAEKDASGKSVGFVRGKWASPAGPAATDGKLWKPAPTTRPALLVGRHKAAVQQIDPKKPLPDWATQAVGGNVILVKDGKAVSHKNTDRHPRTVAGVDKSGTKLILLVVDGRQKDLSIGMTYAELSRELIAAGAWEGINLDGGGSTTLIMRDPQSRELKLINSPSDGRERNVADVLGVKVSGPLPSTRAAHVAASVPTETK